MPRVVMFVFWGRRANIELQLPFIRRILAEHPDVEFDAWNLAREPTDDEYLRTLDDVRHDFAGGDAWVRMNEVYRFYAQSCYQDCFFVKFDDDIVFMQTDRFGEFLDAVVADGITSGMVVNNGACTRLQPELWERFSATGIPLLDVHLKNRFADMAHAWFFDNWRDVLAQPVEIVDTEDWLSINWIGFDWYTMRRIASRIGKTPHPRVIAGRRFRTGQTLGDEGLCNMLPRRIMKGFTVAHLSFHPQKLREDQLTEWHRAYAEIAQTYLDETVVLPAP